MTFLRTIFSKVLKSCLWLVYLLILLQLAGFVYFNLPSTKPIGGVGYPKGLYVSKKIGFGYRPNFKGHFVGGAFRDVEIQINSHGFRDGPFEKKPPNAKRILVLGDSIPFAPGVKKEDRFTEHLESLFQKKNPQSVEILNLAVNSYASRHYVALVQSKILQELAPDAMILSLHFNDIFNYAWPEALLKKSDTPEGLSLSNTQILTNWLEGQYAFLILKELQKRYIMYKAVRSYEYYERWLEKLTKAWSDPNRYEEIKGRIQKMKEVSSTNGYPFLVIVIPELSLLSKQANYIAHTNMIRLLNELEIPFCDLNQFPPQDLSLEAYYLPNDNTHLSAKGHEHFSKIIHSCALQKLKLFGE